MTSRFCRWKPCREVQSFGGKFCTRHKCSVVDCVATKLDYADVNYCLAHYRGGSGRPKTSFPNASTDTQRTPLKDDGFETHEAAEETASLAGLDTASTALVVYNGKDRFKGSTCRSSYWSCSEPATGDSPYCRLHKCWRPGCNAQRLFEAKLQKWSQGCGNHSCRYKACLSIREKGSDYCAGHIQPCKVYNCPRRAHANGPWCNFHRLCRTPDCANKRMNYSGYCSLHGCTQSPGCIESKAACTKHISPQSAPAPKNYPPSQPHRQATRQHTHARQPAYPMPYY
ncbi:hypothetical protein V8F33_011863 [Rhypophila sp. PSN 637]